jgi:hypothetical protein
MVLEVTMSPHVPWRHVRTCWVHGCMHAPKPYLKVLEPPCTAKNSPGKAHEVTEMINSDPK